MTPPASDNDETLLDVKDVKTHFFTDEGVVKAVDGVNLSLKRGQTLCVVGESGCGKSVTARSILAHRTGAGSDCRRADSLPPTE